MSEEFKKYMSRFNGVWIGIITAVVLLMVTSCISMLARDDFDIVPQIVMFIIVLLCLIPLLRSQKFFKSLEDESLVTAVEADFNNALPFRNDRIRFGENWVFSKNSANLVKYSDIAQVYQYIHKTNFIENDRALKYVNTQGKHGVLCKLELRGKSDEEVAKMVTIICSKNPNVKIGYH